MKVTEKSPASRVMNEAIELTLAGRSPYPERAAFVDADSPTAGREICRAADQGLAIVLVSADGTTQTLSPAPVAGD
jgi:hypothetical protein